MPHSNIITQTSEDETWLVIAGQLSKKEDNRDYTAQFATENHSVTLDIDLHPDSGDENGKPSTSFSAHLAEETTFRFNIEKQGLKHNIGKLFGTQDVIIGNAEFDKRFLIQSNDVDKVKEILSNTNVSAPLMEQQVIDFEIRESKIGGIKEIVLDLDIEGAITDPAVLRNMFNSFKAVLNYLK